MKDCVSCVHEYLSPMSDTCRECGIAMLNYKEAKPKPITNADRIRSMTDEELAGILAMQRVVSPPWCAENYDCPYADQDPVRCDLCALDWLRQEVTTNSTT